MSQYEARDGDKTTGSYSVILPDGRKQTVNYYVDGYSGYVADVQYDGYAKAYDYKPTTYKADYKPEYKPAYKPSYEPEYKPTTYKADYKPTTYKTYYKPTVYKSYEPTYSVPAYKVK